MFKFLIYSTKEYKIMVFQGCIILTLFLIGVFVWLQSGNLPEFLIMLCGYLAYSLLDKAKEVKQLDPLARAYLEANNG